MNKDFYKDDSGQFLADVSSLDYQTGQIPDFKTVILENGNKISESKLASEWFYQTRSNIINKYQLIQAEINTQKSAIYNEFTSIQKYFSNNILNDHYERNETFIPTSILSLGAFFTGRIMTNGKNWGSKKSFISKIITSIPARFVLPWILSGYVYSQLTPKTWNNAVSYIEKDSILRDFIFQYYTLSNDYYTNGIKYRVNKFNEFVNQSLQSNIKNMRTTISEMTK